MGNIESLKYFIPELIIVVSILVVVLLDLIKLKKYILSFIVIIPFFIGFSLCSQGYSNEHIFLGMLSIDSLSYYFKWIMLLSTFSILIVSFYSKKLDKEYMAEYNMLLLCILLGMFLMVSSVNLIMIYLAIELVSIPSYILAGIIKNDKKSNEASLKYVIFGSFASGLMLYGLSLLYGVSGSFELHVIADAILNVENPYMLYMSIILILVGFGYKISMAPMHYWTPDVYEGSPTTITAFLSVAPKAAGFGLLMRVFMSIFTQGQDADFALLENVEGYVMANWSLIIAVLAAATMTIGNVLAIKQDNVKRMLAYSTISHVGFMLMAFSTVSVEANIAITIYLTIYMFMNLAAFYMVIYAENQFNAQNLDDWNGLGYKNMVLGACMVITLVSLAGLPPTSGFFGKVYLFRTLFAENKYIWLGIVGILNSVVSLYYYFRIVKRMYFKEVESTSTIKSHPVIYWSIILLSSQNILFYFYWDNLYNYIKGLFI